jgi:hypothetical protein
MMGREDRHLKRENTKLGVFHESLQKIMKRGGSSTSGEVVA